MGRVARHAENVQLYLAFKRSTTPIHGKGCASRRHVGKNVQLYLAFVRLTTPVHRKGCASCRKCATLPRVQAFDHANPWEGLRVMLKMRNFTSRSSVRPRQSTVRVARHVENVQLYLTFKRSTTPIHGKGCALRIQVGKMCNFTSRSCV